MTEDKGKPGTRDSGHPADKQTRTDDSDREKSLPQPDHPETTGKYRINQIVGQGAMGMVYKGFDPYIERVVAIKVIKKNPVAGQQWAAQQARFKREAQAAGRLQHPNIVTVHEYGEDDGAPFIVMEYVEGTSLAGLLQQKKRLPIMDAVDIMRKLLDALDYSHSKGVIHRDIKPANVFILENGGVKLSDFGIAKLEASELTVPGMILGTPVYMSPEQLKGQKVDPRSDLFSAGIVFYEMVTGRRPFTGDRLLTLINSILTSEHPDPCELNPDLPEAFKVVIYRSLSKNPDDRYPSARQFAFAIQDALERAPTVALPGPALPVDKKPIWPIALAILLLMVAAVSGAWLWTSTDKKLTATKRAHAPVVDTDKTRDAASIMTEENPGTIEELVAVPEKRKKVLYVKTVPQNVEVFIDGQFVGITPLKYFIRPGTHQIAMKKNGYMSFRDEIIIGAGSEKLLEYNAELFRGFE